MGWADTIAEGFPPLHDGEPTTLRRDISDELEDHLACAMERELRREEDEAVARQAVLKRFGDPKSIARRLWWDAMKEKIMKDRLFLVVTLLVFVAVIAAFVMPWAAQQNKINAQILEKLEALNAPAAKSDLPENWSKAKIRLVEGGQEGPPVGDHVVSLKGEAFTDKEIHLNQKTDREGVATFGPLRPGRYEIAVPRFGLRYTKTIELYPGQVGNHVVICPDRNIQSEVSFEVTPPLDGLGEVLIGCGFRRAGRVPLGPDWFVDNVDNLEGTLYITPAGAVVFAGGVSIHPVSFPGRSGSSVRANAGPLQTRPARQCLRVPHQLMSVSLWRLSRDVKGPGAGDYWVQIGSFSYSGAETQPVLEPKPGATTFTIRLPEALIEQARQAKPLATLPAS